MAKRDLGEVKHRVEERKALLDQVLRPSHSISHQQIVHTDAIAKQELQLWRQTLEDGDLSEGRRALLLLDRVWRVREYLDEPTWLKFVQEAGEAALDSEGKGNIASSRVALLLRYRLGLAYLRSGQIVNGVRMYEDMLDRVREYEKELELDFERVQSGIAWEKAKARAKYALAGALTGLSYGLQMVGTVAQFVPMVNGAGAAAAKGGTALNQYAQLIQAGGSLSASFLNSINPGLDAALHSLQHSRYKSLETIRLFGSTPRALPLFLNEHERLEFHQELGRAYEKLQRPQQAIDQYKNAIDIVESERAGLGKENTRLAFLTGKDNLYANLVTLLVRAGDNAAAFEYAERARSRNLVDVLASAAPKFSTGSESEAYERQRREQTEVQLTVQRNGLTHHEVTRLRQHNRGITIIKSTDEPVTVSSQTAKHIADKDNTELGSSPEFESLTAVQVSSSQQISSQLGGQAAMLAFFVTDKETIVFAMQEGKLTASITPIGRTALLEEVDGLRRSIYEDRLKQHNGNTAHFKKGARRLYDLLLKDVIGGITKEVLYVAPHGPLHYLPFSLLYDGSQYLVDRFTVVNIPSATVLTYLNDKRQTRNEATIVFANPDLGDARFNLPFAEQEGYAVLARKPKALLFTRKDAQETKARKLGKEAGILHFATHGQFKRDRPMDSALLLANGGGDDGTLTASEIFGLALPGTLVVLSACETGLSQVATGDEIIGLTRAFMYAGAPQLIATLWEIDDQATSDLMDTFYAELGMQSPPGALRAAQLSLRKRHPQPFYWAGFVAYGLHR